MISLYENLQTFGQQSIDVFWFPVLVWSLLTFLVLSVLKAYKHLNPLYQYHIRVAMLLSLPIGLIITQFVRALINYKSSLGSFNPTLFIIENPIPDISISTGLVENINYINWFESNFLIGVITILVMLVGSIILLRLAMGFISLIKLRSNLDHEPLVNINSIFGFEKKVVSVAFHNYKLVPFTFGWKKPVIVLPSSIQSDKDKLNMAIQHELVHIRRGDYLLQLILSLIHSLFWFHPLVHLTNKGIETYREISCDLEVLSSTNIKPKSYATLLYELLPLNRNWETLAISMAVKQSTLKQRIEIMNNYKTYKAPYKRSLLLLLSMVVIIIAPIACSDLQNTEVLTTEELSEMNLNFDKSTITINGQNIPSPLSVFTDENKINALFGLALQTENHGLFIISTQKFPSSRLAGSVKENKIELKINELNVEIFNDGQSILNGQADIWVRHFALEKARTVNLAILPYDILQKEDPLNFLNTQNSNQDHNSDIVDTETFVVVEQMPKLVGGRKSIQSKIEYPPSAIRAGIEGRVIVKFIVDEEGNIVDPEVVKGIGGGCDEEALRVVKEANFTPGKQRGKNVKVQLSLPVIFKLTK